MNYYSARRRADSDPPVYDYTRRNDDLITPEGYCRQKVPCPRSIERIEAAADLRRCEASCEICHGAQFVPNPDYCGGHPTPEGAEECFARYIKAQGTCEEKYTDWTGCEAESGGQEGANCTTPAYHETHRYCPCGWMEGTKCDEPTKTGLRSKHPLGRHMALCDEHRTVEIFEAAAPRRAGQITASY